MYRPCALLMEMLHVPVPGRKPSSTSIATLLSVLDEK